MAANTSTADIIYVTSGAMKGYVPVNKEATMEKVRELISSTWDEDMLPSEEWVFIVDGILISSKQEKEQIPWGREIVIESKKRLLIQQDDEHESTTRNKRQKLAVAIVTQDLSLASSSEDQTMTPKSVNGADSAAEKKDPYQFNGPFRGFDKYLNESINNKNDRDLFERENIVQEILGFINPIEESPKPICATVWSGRGSGKTSLIRKMAKECDFLKEARDCGRLMIFDSKRETIGDIPDDLAVGETLQIVGFISVLVAFHLCKIFGDASVDGVVFKSTASFQLLWKGFKSNGNTDLDASLTTKLKSIHTGTQAYDWWKSCTRGFLEPGTNNGGPNPVIFIDTAELLAIIHRRPSPKNKKKAATEESKSAGAESITIQSSPAATASAEMKAKAATEESESTVTESIAILSSPAASASAERKASTHHRHLNGEDERRYLVLEWIMMNIPNNHAMIVFGTGQRRDLPEPLDFLTNVNHNRFAPLNALSENAAMHVFAQTTGVDFKSLTPEDERYVKMVYAVTAGIPRMLLNAFTYHKTYALQSTSNKIWENHASYLYEDSSRLVYQNKLSVSCLAKAVLISAVCNIPLDNGNMKIPGENHTWDDLKWLSIAFLTGRASDQNCHFIIPRLLWHKEATNLTTWVKTTCGFNLNDLLPTIRYLYNTAGNASAPSSGIAWEKMIASVLVARFFALCWMENREPDNAYIGLDQLLPEKNKTDMETLREVEVCLANGIHVFPQNEKAMSVTKTLGDNVDSKAILANWEHKSAHHDMILPVRKKLTTQVTTFAVSARNGHHKTEKELIDTEQHLVQKKSTTEVEGVIQALNPRHTQSGRTLKNKFKLLTEEKKYAECIITEGHVHHVLGCFS